MALKRINKELNDLGRYVLHFANVYLSFWSPAGPSAQTRGHRIDIVDTTNKRPDTELWLTFVLQ